MLIPESKLRLTVLTTKIIALTLRDIIRLYYEINFILKQYCHLSSTKYPVIMFFNQHINSILIFFFL